jgi:hypothetical protein
MLKPGWENQIDFTPLQPLQGKKGKKLSSFQGKN